MTLTERINAHIDQIDALEKEFPHHEEFQSGLGLGAVGLAEALDALPLEETEQGGGAASASDTEPSA